MKVLGRQKAMAYCGDQKNALSPAIVAFMRGKPAQICPSALKDMQAAFHAAVLAADKVAVIGVNPHIVDGHIWDSLAETNTVLALCGDENAFDDWATNHRCGRPTRYLGGRFADSVDQLIGHSLLSSSSPS
jgi:hypothetical protein